MFKRIICYCFHREHWSKRRFLGYTDHNTEVKCNKCETEFTLD